MKPRPCYRLMARSGVPIAALLLASRQHEGPSPWTVLEYAIAVAMVAATSAAGIYGASLAMDVFGF